MSWWMDVVAVVGAIGVLCGIYVWGARAVLDEDLDRTSGDW